MQPAIADSRSNALDFLAELRAALGPEATRSDDAFLARYTRDVSGFRRTVVAVLFPTDTAQIVTCVEAARRHGIPLYPVSTGMNWGLGSALPVRDGAAIVDLRGMNRIRALDTRRGYAVVEPGVTQQALHARLCAEHAPFFLNVTGAPTGHSIIGNALERGVGMFGPQSDLVTVSEVVLGTGAVLTPGFPQAARASVFYPHGIGPDLGGLFFQSSFGIVTAARVRLLPRPQQLAHVFCSIRDRDQFPDVVEQLADLRRLGVLDGALHFANADRSLITLRPVLLQSLRKHGWTDEAELNDLAKELLGNQAPWSLATTLRGSSARIKDAWQQLRRRLGRSADLRLVTPARLAVLKTALRALHFVPALRKQHALLEAIEPLLDLASGIPSDSPLACTFPDAPTDPGASTRGLLFCLPIVPLDGHAMMEVEQTVGKLFARDGFQLCLTFNSNARDAVEGVVALVFDRSVDDETARAQRCIDQTTRALTALGYPLYRAGITSMNFAIAAGGAHPSILQALKETLDPQNIIAPGRYQSI